MSASTILIEKAKINLGEYALVRAREKGGGRAEGGERRGRKKGGGAEGESYSVLNSLFKHIHTFTQAAKHALSSSVIFHDV